MITCDLCLKETIDYAESHIGVKGISHICVDCHLIQLPIYKDIYDEHKIQSQIEFVKALMMEFPDSRIKEDA